MTIIVSRAVGAVDSQLCTVSYTSSLVAHPAVSAAQKRSQWDTQRNNSPE